MLETFKHKPWIAKCPRLVRCIRGSCVTGRSPRNQRVLGAGSPRHAHASRRDCPHCTRAQTPNDSNLARAFKIKGTIWLIFYLWPNIILLRRFIRCSRQLINIKEQIRIFFQDCWIGNRKNVIQSNILIIQKNKNTVSGSRNK